MPRTHDLFVILINIIANYNFQKKFCLLIKQLTELPYRTYIETNL